MISYVLGPYSRFLDKEKGCTYATDVPGAVKNVSSLNPLEIAVLNDNRDDASRKGASGIRIRAFAREAALLRRFDAEPSSTLRGA